jgi:hypothetical protein
MNNKEELRYLTRAATEHPPYVHGGRATKPNDIGKDNGVEVCGAPSAPFAEALRLAARPARPPC